MILGIPRGDRISVGFLSPSRQTQLIGVVSVEVVVDGGTTARWTFDAPVGIADTTNMGAVLIIGESALAINVNDLTPTVLTIDYDSPIFKNDVWGLSNAPPPNFFTRPYTDFRIGQTGITI